MTNKIQRLAKVSAVALSTFGLVANTAFAQSPVYFKQGGDSLNSTVIFGTNDNYGINIKTNAQNRMIVTNDGRIGIGGEIASGDLTPEFELDIDGSFIARGQINSGKNLLTTGSGTRMIWHSKKAAFRAGFVDANQWDETNIGILSFAIGDSTKASGMYSFAGGSKSEATTSYAFAFGDGAKATGSMSAAFGHDSTASGNYSFVHGKDNSASGITSTAWGDHVSAIGTLSTAWGNGSKADSYVSTVLGQHNIGGGNPTGWIATDPLFEIGNGTGPTAKSNALTVLKNGNIGIGTHTPTEKLAVNGNVSVTGNITTNAQLKANSVNITNNLEVNGSANFRSGQISLRPYTNHLLKPTQPACDGNNVGTIIFFEDQFKGCTSKGWKNLDM